MNERDEVQGCKKRTRGERESHILPVEDERESWRPIGFDK